jgi:hypothetical protein
VGVFGYGVEQLNLIDMKEYNYRKCLVSKR